MIATSRHDEAGAARLLVADPARSYRSLRTEIDAAIERVLDRGWFILGQEVASFETEFAGYLGCRHAIGVASGTDALRVALIASGIAPGDEVITVANAGDPTPMAICSVGAVPRLVDVDPSSGTLSAESAEKAIGQRTRALLPVHLYGQPADLAGLSQLARSAGLRLIEDACQAHGARYRRQMVGTIGDFGCFSFYPTKNLGALGDGGMLVTNDDELAERARLVREYGWKPRNHALIRGINSRLDELQAAVLRVKLPCLETWNERRRALAARYRRGLADLTAACPGLALPDESPDCQHVYHLYVVQTDRRDAIRAALTGRGIGTGIHYPNPTHLQPAFAGFWDRGPSLPVTESLARRVLSLPMFPELTDGEVDRVVEEVQRAWAQQEA
ncbi:MAG: DegT/DnrJ/EryC1/StrS family aminotransferase [Chloroflexota bacterium]